MDNINSLANLAFLDMQDYGVFEFNGLRICKEYTTYKDYKRFRDYDDPCSLASLNHSFSLFWQYLEEELEDIEKAVDKLEKEEQEILTLQDDLVELAEIERWEE